MALGTVSSLGVGSNFELQDMLDKLRNVDEAPIRTKEATKARTEAQLTEFDALNAKLIKLKSSTLTLSLQSEFLERDITVSDEDVATAVAQNGILETDYDLEVKELATKSSWQSVGVESGSAIIYPPPVTNITNSTSTALSQKETLSFTIGYGTEQKSISLELASGSSLDSVAKAINEVSSNQNGNETYVKASVESGSGGMYIRLESTDTNSANNNQILVSAGPDFVKPDVSFAYKIGVNSDQSFIAVKAGTSYSQMAELINEDPGNSGINASIIDDGSGTDSTRLTLTSKNSGEDNRIYLNGLAMEEVQGKDTSLNSSFTVNGVQYQRQSNESITDVVSGLSITLEKVGETSFDITASLESVTTEIKTLIEGFNEIVQDIKVGLDNSESDGESEDEEGKGVLYGVSSMSSLSRELVNILESIVTIDGKSLSIVDFGVSVNRDGTITLDEEALDEAVKANPDQLKDLFIGDSNRKIKGLGDILNESLRNITSLTGTLESEKNSATEKITRLNQSIADAKVRLTKKYDIMADQFVRLDVYMNTMKSQADYLTSVFDSFESANNKK